MKSLSSVLLALAVCLPAFAADRLLWQIGTPGNRASDFALAPDGYQRYRTPGFFVIGASDPARDWPYIQPGPSDGGWAARLPHSFHVWFALEQPPAEDATLVLGLADTQEVMPPAIRTTVNEHQWEHRTPAGAGAFSAPQRGREHVIRIPVPANALRRGLNQVTITIFQGSWLIWDHLRLEGGGGAVPGKVADFAQTLLEGVAADPALLRWQGTDRVRQVHVEVVHLAERTRAELRIGPSRSEFELEPGRTRLTVTAPAVTEPTTFPVELRVGGQVAAAGEIELAPVRQWTVHLVHQTHLDIGYTHTQEEVLALQVDYFRRVLDLIKQTADYPEGARFIWHPEGMWAVDEFLRVASAEERREFIEACRNRQIHLDVLYAQAMSGVYTDEELFALMDGAKRFEREHGVRIDSAMQSDVPGYTWGLASVLAANGVHYVSVGPNAGHRIGHTFHWGDRPFYWEAPHGGDRVLFWMAGRGYSMFLRSGVAQYGGIEDNLLVKHIDEVLAYLQDLEQAGYPYDRVMLRYSIGSDNGPPDSTLPGAVAEWNRRHASPRLVIDTNSGFLKDFEQRYRDDIPVLRGDFTPYWEDGVASTSLATGVNRRACERIAQAQILWAMRRPGLALHADFDDAWTHLVMYDEHTWGAWNSISAPDDPFVVQQDEYKQNYAFNGARLTDALLERIVPPAPGRNAVDVHNTASHPRGGLVRLDAGQSSAGDLVRDDAGTPVPSQRLAAGELAFLAPDIPAFGTRRFTLHAAEAQRRGAAVARGHSLSNGFLTVEIDPASGALKSLRRRGVEGDWVDPSAGGGLNDYLYILGRNPEEGRARVEGPVTVVVEDAGPLVATLRIESNAPGCERLIRRVQLVDGQDHVDLVNITHKLKERRPEGVYFGFPFNLPGATTRIDVPWAVVEVEKDQLPGANRNFYCVQRWVDLATADRGVTWVTVDAPLLQFDPIKISAHAWAAHAFRTYIDPGSHIWSWTMNNHWETNYKADQEGEIIFRYAIRPYTGGYDQVAAQRFGRAVTQPLLAVAVDPQTAVNPPLVTVNGSGSVVATTVRPSRDTRAWLVRLFNEGTQPARATLQWHAPVGTTWISNPQEDALSPAPRAFELRPYQIVTLRVDRAPAR